MRRLAQVAFLSGLALPACVIRYGEGPKTPDTTTAQSLSPVDFGTYERQLAAMVDAAEEVDQRDRLDAAWELAQQMRDKDPTAQHQVRGYLDRLIEIESRTRPAATPLQTQVLSEGFGGAARVGSTELAGPEPLAEPAPVVEVDLLDPMALEAQGSTDGEVVVPPEPEGPNPDALLTDARRLAEAGDRIQAMSTLEACKALPCWSAVEPDWNTIRDAHVFSEKESLAVRFLELRGEPEVATQRAGLLEIQAALSTLRATWPGNAHEEAIEDHIRRVQKELELLPEE